MDRIARFELDYDFVPDIDALKYALICIFESAPVFHSQFIDNHIAPYWKVCDSQVYSLMNFHTLNPPSIQIKKKGEEHYQYPHKSPHSPFQPHSPHWSSYCLCGSYMVAQQKGSNSW